MDNAVGYNPLFITRVISSFNWGYNLEEDNVVLQSHIGPIIGFKNGRVRLCLKPFIDALMKIQM